MCSPESEVKIQETITNIQVEFNCLLEFDSCLFS